MEWLEVVLTSQVHAHPLSCFILTFAAFNSRLRLFSLICNL